MRQQGLRGVIRGRSLRTTVPDAKAPCPLDRVNRQFQAERPNQLWASDFTYVSTWQGFVYVAFVIDVFSRWAVGRRICSSMKSWLRLNGSRGSTTIDCSNRWATSRPPRLRQTTGGNKSGPPAAPEGGLKNDRQTSPTAKFNRPHRSDSRQLASAKAGAAI